MTVVLAAVGGASLMLALLLGGCILGLRIMRKAAGARSMAGAFLRTFSVTSDIESLVLYFKGEPVIVGLEELARAFDKGEIITHTQPPALPTGEPPFDDSCDGNA